MSQIIDKREFFITSGNQLNSNSNSFTYKIQIPDTINYNRVTLLQCNIPISYYLIQNGLNEFYLEEPGFDPILLYLTPGNYNVNSFASTLTTLLNNKSPNGYTYSITFPNNYSQVNTGMFTYQVNTINETISFIFLDNPLNEQFGFNSKSTVSFTPLVDVSQLTSTNVVKFVPEDTLFIHSDIASNPGNYGNSDVLQEVYNSNSIPFSNIAWINPDPLAYSKDLSTTKNQTITFSITDENGRGIYLNGLNMTLTIMIYKDPDFYLKAENVMKIYLEKLKIDNSSE